MSIVLLTDASSGKDKSVIRRHLPGWCFFGIIPNQLIWTAGADCGEKGPRMLPF